MKRALLVGSVVFLVIGCQLPEERAPVKPLPEDIKDVPAFAELLTRARRQATAATESFYVNKWTELEDQVRGLEQTARFLGKAPDVPAGQKNMLPAKSGDLAREATRLRELCKDKDVKQTNETLQRIHLVVRELGPNN